MKSRCLFVAVLFVVGMGLCTGAQAAGKSFVSVNAGCAYANDSDVDFDSGPDAEFSFDDGYVVSASIGGWLSENWRAETEVLYQENDFDDVNALGGSVDIDGDASITALMGNIYYDFTNDSIFTPFLTAGIGGAEVEVSDVHADVLDPYFLEGDDEIVFAYQLGAGMACQLNEQWFVDVKYRYFGISDAEFEISDAEFDSHNIYAGLRFSFAP